MMMYVQGEMCVQICSSVEDNMLVVDTRIDHRGGTEEGGDGSGILPRRLSP
jgi:hypothetical protein